MLIDNFEDASDIAKHVKCSERTIYNYKANMKLYGQPRSISVSRMGLAKKMIEENIEVYILYSQIQRR